MASRIVQGICRNLPAARNSLKQSRVHKKFDHFTGDGDVSANNYFSTISTQTKSRPVATATEVTASSSSTQKSSMSAYASVAPGVHPNHLNPKFVHPTFEEAPTTVSTLDNIVEQIEKIPQVKTASEEQLKKILALGDMRIWQ